MNEPSPNRLRSMPDDFRPDRLTMTARCEVGDMIYEIGYAFVPEEIEAAPQIVGIRYDRMKHELWHAIEEHRVNPPTKQ